MMKLPIAFEAKMKALLNEEYDDYIASYELPQYQGLRINTLKLELDQWKELNPFKTLQPVPWCKEGFYYDSIEKPAKHPYYFAGLYYIQEPSAMTPGAYLPIEPGDRVLDMCAAPGGKSTHLAARMKHKGILVANDISASRSKGLLKNLENFGARQIIVTSETSEKLASKWEGYFDKILIDAPCSGEGMFRKNENAIKGWETHGVEYCMPLQQTILEDAARLLKPSGMILYSTCTFSPEENEGMINTFLDNHPEFSVVPLTPIGGIQNGRPDFIDAREELKGALRLWPHYLKGEGHFVCLIERKEQKEIECPRFKASKQLKDYPAAYEFLKEYTHLELDIKVLEINNKLYHLSEDAPDLTGIRVLRGGLFLGELKNKRFEPSHVLALAYPMSVYKNTINWTVEDEAVKRYLKGETVLCDRPKGYYVMCVEGYPLGWVKAQNGMLKNQYPPSWRLC